MKSFRELHDITEASKPTMLGTGTPYGMSDKELPVFLNPSVPQLKTVLRKQSPGNSGRVRFILGDKDILVWESSSMTHKDSIEAMKHGYLKKLNGDYYGEMLLASDGSVHRFSYISDRPGWAGNTEYRNTAYSQFATITGKLKWKINPDAETRFVTEGKISMVGTRVITDPYFNYFSIGHPKSKYTTGGEYDLWAWKNNKLQIKPVPEGDAWEFNHDTQNMDLTHSWGRVDHKKKLISMRTYNLELNMSHPQKLYDKIVKELNRRYKNYKILVTVVGQSFIVEEATSSITEGSSGAPIYKPTNDYKDYMQIGHGKGPMTIWGWTKGKIATHDLEDGRDPGHGSHASIDTVDWHDASGRIDHRKKVLSVVIAKTGPSAERFKDLVIKRLQSKFRGYKIYHFNISTYGDDVVTLAEGVKREEGLAGTKYWKNPVGRNNLLALVKNNGNALRFALYKDDLYVWRARDQTHDDFISLDLPHDDDDNISPKDAAAIITAMHCTGYIKSTPWENLPFVQYYADHGSNFEKIILKKFKSLRIKLGGTAGDRYARKPIMEAMGRETGLDGTKYHVNPLGSQIRAIVSKYSSGHGRFVTHNGKIHVWDGSIKIHDQFIRDDLGITDKDVHDKIYNHSGTFILAKTGAAKDRIVTSFYAETSAELRDTVKLLNKLGYTLEAHPRHRANGIKVLVEEEAAAAPTKEKKKNKSVAYTYGRFNPFTKGHEKLVRSLIKQAAKHGIRNKNNVRVYMSRSQDHKKNPLSFKYRQELGKTLFSGAEVQFPDLSTMTTPFHVFERLVEVEGFNDILVVVGSDRVKEFEDGFNKMIVKKGYDVTVRVISAGFRDNDSDGVSGVSASKMRVAAIDGDLKGLKKGIPRGLEGIASDILREIRKGLRLPAMGVIAEEGFIAVVDGKKMSNTNKDVSYFSVGHGMSGQQGDKLTLWAWEGNKIKTADGDAMDTFAVTHGLVGLSKDWAWGRVDHRKRMVSFTTKQLTTKMSHPQKLYEKIRDALKRKWKGYKILVILSGESYLIEATDDSATERSEGATSEGDRSLRSLTDPTNNNPYNNATLEAGNGDYDLQEKRDISVRGLVYYKNSLQNELKGTILNKTKYKKLRFVIHDGDLYTWDAGSVIHDHFVGKHLMLDKPEQRKAVAMGGTFTIDGDDPEINVNLNDIKRWNDIYKVLSGSLRYNISDSRGSSGDKYLNLMTITEKAIISEKFVKYGPVSTGSMGYPVTGPVMKGYWMDPSYRDVKILAKKERELRWLFYKGHLYVWQALFKTHQGFAQDALNNFDRDLYINWAGHIKYDKIMGDIRFFTFLSAPKSNWDRVLKHVTRLGWQLTDSQKPSQKYLEESNNETHSNATLEAGNDDFLTEVKVERGLDNKQYWVNPTQRELLTLTKKDEFEQLRFVVYQDDFLVWASNMATHHNFLSRTLGVHQTSTNSEFDRLYMEDTGYVTLKPDGTSVAISSAGSKSVDHILKLLKKKLNYRFVENTDRRDRKKNMLTEAFRREKGLNGVFYWVNPTPGQLRSLLNNAKGRLPQFRYIIVKGELYVWNAYDAIHDDFSLYTLGLERWSEDHVSAWDHGGYTGLNRDRTVLSISYNKSSKTHLVNTVLRKLGYKIQKGIIESETSPDVELPDRSAPSAQIASFREYING